MALNRNKSDIAESFRNLLKKADEMALEQKKDAIISDKKLDQNTEYEINGLNYTDIISDSNRLGIKSIKRIPQNPFKTKNKLKSEDYIKCRKELIIKLSIILNKHIHYWLQRELPKYSKVRLEKQIYSLLANLKNSD